MQRYSLCRTAPDPVSKRGQLVGLVWRAPSIILPDGGVLRVGEGACGAVAQACEVVLVAAKSLRRGLHLEGAKALIDHLQGSEKGGGVVSTALVGFGGQCRAKHLPDDVVVLHGSPPPSAPSLCGDGGGDGLGRAGGTADGHLSSSVKLTLLTYALTTSSRLAAKVGIRDTRAHKHATERHDHM